MNSIQVNGTKYPKKSFMIPTENFLEHPNTVENVG